MKLIFLNILNCALPNPVRAFFKQHLASTDGVLLQEAYERSKWILKDVLCDYHLTFDYKYNEDTSDFPQATYIKNTVDIIEEKTLLKGIAGIGLGIYSKIRFSGRDFHIINVHGLPWPGDKKDNDLRILQSKSILDFAQGLEGSLIIGGDFNLDIDTQSVKMFEDSGYRNLIREFDVKTTRNRLIWEKYPNSKQYFCDYVFVSKDVKVKSFFAPDIEISDHLPMILEVDS